MKDKRIKSFSCKYIKVFGLMMLTMLLGACATMDVSSLETAEAISRGKTRFTYATGNGFNLNHRSGISHGTDADIGYTLSPIVTTGGAAIGLGRATELGCKINLLSHTWGIKTTIKKQLLDKPSGYSLALLGGGTATSFGGPPSLGGGKINPQIHYWSDPYDSYGTEIQLIGSKRWNPKIITSLILKGNSTYRKGPNNERIYHGGLRANAMFGADLSRLIPEIGMDFYMDPHDKLIWTPRFNIALCLQN